MLTKEDLEKIGKIVKKEIYPVKKDIKTIVGFFDKEHLGLKKRVKRVEEHLNLPPASS